MSRTVFRTGCALVLVLVAASAAQALPPSASFPAGSERGILAAVWDWAASWASPAGWRSAWEAAGCQMDPDGLCRPGEKRIDAGAGRGLTPFWEKEGCQIDPNGKPCDTNGTRAEGASAERKGVVRRVRN